MLDYSPPEWTQLITSSVTLFLNKVTFCYGMVPGVGASTLWGTQFVYFALKLRKAI